MDGKHQNDVPELPTLDKERYENLFKVYNVSDSPNNFYFYNINNSVKIDPDQIDEAYIIEFDIDTDMPWTTLAFRLYGSIYLWWLIKILNPTSGIFKVQSGTSLKVIKPEYINQTLEIIKAQINL